MNTELDFCLSFSSQMSDIFGRRLLLLLLFFFTFLHLITSFLKEKFINLEAVEQISWGPILKSGRVACH